MSEFTGEGQRVRCIDCANLVDGHCTAKDTTVAPKKRRLCTKYVFAGEYENRETASAMYVPWIDKKTKKMIARLAALGITPVSSREQSMILAPKTTADTSKPEEPLIWTPDMT